MGQKATFPMQYAHDCKGTSAELCTHKAGFDRFTVL
jgi:hypothetical protein